MSFLDDILGLGKKTIGFLQSPGLGPTLAKTALTGLALNQLSKSVNKTNVANRDTKGTLVTVNPNTENSIPVIYGRAIVGGVVTDARLTADNLNMFYCYVLSERTGTLLSTGQQSVISFEEIYWNNNKVVLKSDGITASHLLAEDGYRDDSVNGLIKFYCYNNGSTTQIAPNGYNLISPQAAYSLFPEWTANHTMDELVFVIIKVTYSSKNNITGIGDCQFRLKNTMTKPGDVLYDYMTNTRYGAGIPSTEIASS